MAGLKGSATRGAATVVMVFAGACASRSQSSADVVLEPPQASASLPAPVASSADAIPAPWTPSRAEMVKSAKRGAEEVRMAAELYLSEDPDGCPRVDELVDAKKIDPRHTKDPWGRHFKVLCSKDGEVRGLSFGADGIEGSADDIADDMTPRDLERISEL